jgi:hypothetical protein
MGAFLGIVGYFTALTLVIGSFATLMFRTDPLRN